MAPRKTGQKAPGESLALQKADRYQIDQVSSPRHLRVNMANTLVTAAQGLTLAEKRIVSLSIAKLDSYKLAENFSPSVKITAADYVDSFEVDANTAYEQLQVATKRLYWRSITFLAPKPGQEDHPGVKSMRWISTAEYQRGLAYVEVRFNADLVPLIMGLRKQFTSYNLNSAASLRSVYSFRLLELLSQYSNTGWIKMPVEEFAFAMDATEKQKANFAKLRSQVIEPAVKELIDKDDWIINWKPIKAGRRVDTLHFTFAKNPQGRLI
jgi:plasmid replication initiation protein